MTPFIDHLLTTLKPFVILAGNYAKEIQGRVGKRPAKDATNLFQAALTNADLSVQNFLEVTTLSLFPQVRFMGEEYKDSLNESYFPEKAEVTLFLDPIDGTRIYQDGGDFYSVLLTVVQGGSIVGALAYYPNLGVGYMASESLPTQVFSEGKDSMTPLSIAPVSGEKPLLNVFKVDELKGALEQEFTLYDPLIDYVPGEPFPYLLDVAKGKLAGYVTTSAQLIDGAMLAYLLEKAGAKVTRLSGEPLLPFEEHPAAISEGGLIVALPDVHARILSLLS